MKRNLYKSSVFSVAICAMMSALAIIIMAIGAVLEIADLASAMFASLLIWFIQIEFSASYAVISFAVSSLLGFLFLPSILPAFYFTLLYGWYPPLKYLLDTKIKQKQICFIVKIFIAAIASILEEILARNLLGYAQTMAITLTYIVVTLLLYVVYDILLSRLAVIYKVKWRKHIFRH